MKLKQLLLSALAMVAATTGYAQVNLDEVIEIDGEIYASWNDIDGTWSTWNNCLTAGYDAYGGITFECENDFEVSFDYNVGYDSNFIIEVDGQSQAWVSDYDYERSGSFKKEFSAGMYSIAFQFFLPEGYEGTGSSVEITNFKAKEKVCEHEFPEISEIPATCTEPSKSHCTKCEKLLSDGNSEALSHDYVKGVCKRCGAMDRSCAANADGISLTIDDKDSEYPWKLVDENDPSKGLMSTNQGMHSTTSDLYFTLECEYDYTVSFDWKVSSEAGYDCLNIYVDDVPKKTFIFGETQSSFEYRFDKDTTHSIHLSYSKDVSASDGDDTAYISNIKISCELDATNDGLIEVEDIVMGINMLGSGNLTEEQLNEIIEFILHKE